MVHFVNAAGASVLPFSKHRYQVGPSLPSVSYNALFRLGQAIRN